MRETCTSGSVRGEGGNLLTYSARKGWGINPEEDPSAVGAALCHYRIGAKPNGDLQFCRLVLEMFFDRVLMQLEVKVCRAYGARTILGD